MKQLRKTGFLVFLMAAMTLVMLGGGAAAASNAKITVTIDGKALQLTSPPIIQQGSVLVPMRAIFEALGADIKWDQSTKTVTAVKGDQVIELTIGEMTAKRNGEPVKLAQPAVIKNGSTMVPLRFVGESLGADVKWDSASKTVSIVTGSNAGSAATTVSAGKYRFSFMKNEKFGFIDETGKVVVPAKYDFAGEFSEGLAAVQVGELWGYIDANGTVAIKPQFGFADDFSQGMAVVSDDEYGSFKYINKKGETVVAGPFDLAWPFSEERAVVMTGDEFRFITPSGDFASAESFAFALPYTEGLAAVETMDGKYGFINKSGKFVINGEGVFTEIAEPFSEGLAVVYQDDLAGYIDTTGHWVIKPAFDEAYSFSGGLAKVVLDDLQGFINKQGEFVIEPHYVELETFSDGLALVVDDYGMFYIDTKGNIAVELPEETYLAFKFVNGLAAFFTEDGYGYINKKGKIVHSPSM